MNSFVAIVGQLMVLFDGNMDNSKFRFSPFN